MLTGFLLLSFFGTSQNNFKQFDLYLLIGQSNMAGRGTIEAQDTSIHERVFTLNKDNEWVPAQDPIHFDKPAAGVGLGRSFGITMAENDLSSVIGLIPCAVGGSPIDAWMPGAYYKPTNSHPWDDMIERLKIALKDGKLKGIIWHQGESDSNPKKCNDYETKLISLIERLRAEFRHANIPFVAGELGKFYTKKNKTEYKDLKPCPAQVVVKSTKEVAKNTPNMGFVLTNGLTHNGDSTHFNSNSYRELGIRYANEMIRIQNLH